MQEWFKENRNQLAAAVWFFGLFSLYKICARPNGMWEPPRTTQEFVWCFMVVAAGPVGWGATRRAIWSKWFSVGTLGLFSLLQLGLLIASPNSFGVVILGLLLVSLVQLARWDMAGETEVVGGWSLLEKYRSRPLNPSGVKLQFDGPPSITCEVLAKAMNSAFGRECKISDSTDNIDLGVEAALTDYNTAVVGGVQSEMVGSWMIGARPVSLQVVCVTHDEGAVLRIETPRQFDHEATILDGYDWTIPLAAALWSPKTVCATAGDEEVRFTSSSDLLNWRKKTT